MPRSPYPDDALADARAVLTDAGRMGVQTHAQRLDLVESAFAVLRGDRAARLGQRPDPQAPGSIITIPRAVFEAGRPRPTRRPRLIVLPLGPTPGDAA